jgi:hypothetical protein
VGGGQYAIYFDIRRYRSVNIYQTFRSMITEIAEEQYTLLQGYRSKWQQAAFSLEPLDREIATATLNTAYVLAGYTEPKLFFFNSPSQSIEYLGFPTTREPIVLAGLITPIFRQVRAQFLPILWTRFWRRWGQIYAAATSLAVSDPLIEVLQEEFGLKFPDPICHAIEIQGSAISDVALLDFCITVLGCTHTEPQRWQVLTSLIQDCFWHIAFEDICIVFDRPIQF